MEALREFLQHMMRTVEFLCDRYDMGTQTSENLDVRTSLSIGMPSGSSSMLPSMGEGRGAHLRKEMRGFLMPTHTFQSSGHMIPGQRYEGMLGQMQNFFTQAGSFEERMQGRSINSVEESRLNSAVFESLTSAYGRTAQASPEKKYGDALRTFLHDMKKTIQAWSVRHNMLVQGKAVSLKEVADMEVETTRSAQIVSLDPHPLNSDVIVIGQLERGSDGLPFPIRKDQDIALQLGDEEASKMPQTDPDSLKFKEKSEQTCIVQPKHGEEGGNLFCQAEQGKEDTTSFTLQEVGEAIGIVLCPPQDVADVKEPFQGKTGFQSPSSVAMPPEVNPAQIKSKIDHGEMDVEHTSRNDSGEVDNSVTPKTDRAQLKIPSSDSTPGNLLTAIATPVNNNLEVTIKPFRRKVDVVDSPDWLPAGWITEVKTRGTGNSAGSRDKYYYDPDSKRRFRSKKEVFCFIETGKLGRYKRRPKMKPVKKLLGKEHGKELEKEFPFPGKNNDSRQVKTVHAGDTSGVSSTLIPSSSMSGPAAATSATAHMGLFGNMFMPYRPGQPSDWLVYESLAGLPLPVYEHFRLAEYNLNKSLGNRGPTTLPWFLNNSGGSWRPFVDSTVGKGKEGQGLQSSGVEPRISETIPKQTKRARKSSKKGPT